MPNYIDHIPKALLDDIVENRCLPIVGAGFSRNAALPRHKEMPLWDDLGRLFADELGPNYPYDDPTDVISAYEHTHGRPKLIERLREHLHVRDARAGQVHRMFCDTPFDIVCTTNFDRLLEYGYQASDRYCHSIIRDDQLSTISAGYNLTGLSAATVLLKIHGDEQHPESVVITERDYDAYLSEHPLLSTFLSNLLITRTALFIGYSVGDPDFRQIWQVIKNRLGGLARRAYVIEIKCNDQRRQRFERRNINVVDMPGKSYSSVLEELFRQLREHWISNRPFHFHGVDDETRAQFELPTDASSSLCLIDAPMQLMSFYRSSVMPLIREQSLHPLTVYDVLAPGDNINATLAGIIRRADFLILDLPSIDYMPRLKIDAEQIRGEKQMLIITPHYLRQQLHFQFLEMKHVTVVEREDDIFEKPEELLEAIRKWTDSVISETGIADRTEPSRLLEKREYSAAVISVISLIEVTLSREVSQRSPSEKVVSRGFSGLLAFAVTVEILSQKEANAVREWYAVRNRVVHNRQRVTARSAKTIVAGALDLVSKIAG